MQTILGTKIFEMRELLQANEAKWQAIAATASAEAEAEVAEKVKKQVAKASKRFEKKLAQYERQVLRASETYRVKEAVVEKLLLDARAEAAAHRDAGHRKEQLLVEELGLKDRVLIVGELIC